MTDEGPSLLHASCVAWGGRAVLILGASGAGKSALALDLMSRGCALVADDRTELIARGGRLLARAPAALAGLIEARGVGLLGAGALPEAEVALVVDLDRPEPDRLPPWRVVVLTGVEVPLLHLPATGGFTPAILQYLRGGRRAPDPGERESAPEAPPETPMPDPIPLPTAAFPPGAPRVVLVTGPSGAGRSTAIRALEDLGFEVIDNLPLSLLPRLVEGPPLARPLALGLDVRNRDFGPQALVALIDRLAARPGLAAQLLYLDCAPEVLIRRYSETRRRHPLSPDGPPEAGIARELALLAPVRARADVLIDTGALTVHELRAAVEGFFAPDEGRPLAVTLESFSYKRGLPQGLDIVMDCRFLRNPHWDEALRPLDGRDARVAAYVAADPAYAPFLDGLRGLLLSLLPAYRAEGKSHLAIGLGCTGGQHRSVTVAEAMAKGLAAAGWQVSNRHRELERRAEAAAAAREG